LKLAVDTSQFGRTFQDRSHVFYIRRRPPAVNALLSPTSPAPAPNTSALISAGIPYGKLYNLNVRGKRGNIVETYPAMEYDFVPNDLAVQSGTDLIHIQWTGSNTHNNNGGGDGQGGDDGQGNEGTDRHNFVQILTPQDNYPMPLDPASMTPLSLWPVMDCFNVADGTPIAQLDCQVLLTTSGQFTSAANARATYQSNPFSTQMNSAPPYFRGVLARFKPAAMGRSFNYMCSRNNNFSNRSQKGVLIVQ